MSFWKESAFIISEIGKGVVLNAQNIINVLRNNTDGLGAIKTGVDDANSALGNSTNGLAAIKTDVDNANSALYNSGFGLGAIKTAVDAIGSGGGLTQELYLNTEFINSIISYHSNAVYLNPDLFNAILNINNADKVSPDLIGWIMLGASKLNKLSDAFNHFFPLTPISSSIKTLTELVPELTDLKLFLKTLSRKSCADIQAEFNLAQKIIDANHALISFGGYQVTHPVDSMGFVVKANAKSTGGGSTVTYYLYTDGELVYTDDNSSSTIMNRDKVFGSKFTDKTTTYTTISDPRGYITCTGYYLKLE